MNTVTFIFILLVAAEHLYIMFLETVATASDNTSRIFGIDKAQLERRPVSTLLKNQGVYNGLLALLLIASAVRQDQLWGQLLLCCVVLAALYGAITSNRSILFKQGGLAILGLILSLI